MSKNTMTLKDILHFLEEENPSLANNLYDVINDLLLKNISASNLHDKLTSLNNTINDNFSTLLTDREKNMDKLHIYLNAMETIDAYKKKLLASNCNANATTQKTNENTLLSSDETDCPLFLISLNDNFEFNSKTHKLIGYYYKDYYPVASYKELFTNVYASLYKNDPTTFSNLITDEELSKYLSYNKSSLRRPENIYRGSGIYVETNVSANLAMNILKKCFIKYNINLCECKILLYEKDKKKQTDEEDEAPSNVSPLHNSNNSISTLNNNISPQKLISSVNNISTNEKFNITAQHKFPAENKPTIFILNTLGICPFCNKKLYQKIHIVQFQQNNILCQKKFLVYVCPSCHKEYAHINQFETFTQNKDCSTMNFNFEKLLDNATTTSQKVLNNNTIVSDRSLKISDDKQKNTNSIFYRDLEHIQNHLKRDELINDLNNCSSDKLSIEPIKFYIFDNIQFTNYDCNKWSNNWIEMLYKLLIYLYDKSPILFKTLPLKTSSEQEGVTKFKLSFDPKVLKKPIALSFKINDMPIYLEYLLETSVIVDTLKIILDIYDIPIKYLQIVVKKNNRLHQY